MHMLLESKGNENINEKNAAKHLNQIQKVQFSKYGIYSVNDSNLLIANI